MKTTKQLQRWFNALSLDDRLQVQKFVLILYCIGEDIWTRTEN